MFRTKKDVDRHVHDIFCKLKTNNERTLRCFKIAELYYHVGDFESARRYLSRYMEIRQEAKSYKFMGQILEALGQKEASLVQYKFSFEFDVKQEDLILKVCELMADPEVKINVNRAKHWIDRAENLIPHHKVIFQLKEKILTIERPSNNEDDLEKLITAELAIRKKDVQLRVKLLKHYMEKNKFEEAYKHSTEIEVTNIHRDNLLWYQVLCELLLKCKNSKQSNWSYWIFYISSMERYAALSLKEQGSSVKKTNEAIQAIHNFDQLLFEAKAQSFSRNHSLTESIFMHMWGQLHFHMACLLMQNTKREQNNWTEAGRLCTPLLLSAVHVAPINVTVFKNMQLDNSIKSQLQVWYREGSYRLSQAGHVLHEYSRGNQKMLISSIEKFWTGSWRERIYQRIFIGKIYQKIQTSYFINNNSTNPPLRLISHAELGKYNEVAEEVWPYSLHHQVWPAIKNRNCSGPQPNLSSHLFPDLQFSVYNVNQASPVTLCRLDIDAFLNAAVLCAAAIIEEQRQNNIFNPDRLPILPADLTNSLCTEDQEKWWSAAYKMYRKEALDDVSDIRQNLQRGLEVIRCIGNHGLHPTILVHLARIFHYRAKQLKKKNSENGNILALEIRSELYWSAVIPLLERLQNNQTIRSLNSKLFDYIGKDMNNMELTYAIEEGKLLLAQKLLRDNLYEEAIETLQPLKCPEASFEQGKIYKKLADENISSFSADNLNSDSTNDHRILLLKARNCFYLTLDRLRSPGVDPKHHLNAEIHIYISSIDNELPKFEPDVYSDGNQNNIDDFSEESYSSAHSDEQPAVNDSLTTFNTSSLQTPMHTIRRVPKLASTPRQQSQTVLDVSRNQNEARPSPERLDAQIRQLIHSIESLKKQNREQHKTLISKLDDLIRINARKENQKLYSQKLGMNRNLEEDLYGLYNEEDYRDFNSYSNTSLPTVSSNRASTGLTSNLFTATTPRHPYSPLVYPSPAASAAAAFQNYYQGGPLSFPDPGATAAAAAAAAANQHMSALYPAGVYSMPSLYRNGLEQPIASMQQMTESALQHSLFAQRLVGQLPTQQSLGQVNQMQINEPKFSGYMSINESNVPEPGSTMKDSTSIPIQISNSAPITTPISTPLTTSALISAPTLISSSVSISTPASVLTSAPTSVPTLAPASAPVSTPTSTVTTIRKVPPVNVVITTSDTLPTTVPLIQPTLSVTIPAQHRLGVTPTNTNQEFSAVSHGYQISMPLQPTILTTVNLPPLSTTITMTSPMTKPYITSKYNMSISSVDLHNSGSDATEEEEEEDPIPDFAPIIPLPDEVPITTGEEDEETLFSGRAKLFRFVDKEWKERGIGTVKLLRNIRGKVRLLMRREQVHKICANHMLRRDMEISMMPNNDRAYVWVANDFADEELKLEKLCIRFKTSEEAGNFKENFDKAKNNLPPETDCTTSIQKSITKPVKVETTDKKLVEKVGGFSFSSASIIQKPISDNTSELVQKNPEESIKQSPFASLSFVRSSDMNAITTGSFTFGTSTLSANPTPTFGNNSSKVSVRRPHAIASTPTKDISNIESENCHAEDNEVLLIEPNIHLMQLVTGTNSWEEKGNGLLSVVLYKSTEKIRFLLTEENCKKIIYNQIIPESTEFHLQNCALTWTIGNDKRTLETYTAKFKTKDQAAIFHAKLASHLQKCLKPSNKQITEQKPLSELFKPAVGSWECKDCYTRNSESDTACIACEGLPPNASKAISVKTSIATKPLSQMFKVPGSWECIQCSVINNQTDEHCSACEFSKDLSVDSKSNLGTTKFPSNFGTPDTKAFTFGIPQNHQQIPNKELLSFNFGQLSKTGEKTISSSTCSFGANKNDTSNTSGFLFGTQHFNTSATVNNDGSFGFGSSGKFFDFQFQTKPSPTKSTEHAETSDEDVVEEAEDIHFTPVIPLPDAIDVKTGEEDEEILYSHRSKLFKYDKSTKEWKERGVGDIKLLRHMETKKLRLVMRRDQVLKLCLNHAVTSALEITPKDEKTWIWSTGDYSGGELEYMQLACRFKDSEIAKEFKQAIDNACNSIDSESVVSKPMESLKNTLTDIQVVYELKVSAEEKAAALKLQLPQNFYAYKYKEDCPGCIGCQNTEKSIFETNKTNKQPELMKMSLPTFGSKLSDVLPSTTSQFTFNNTFGKPVTTTSTTTQSNSELNMIFGSTKLTFGDDKESDYEVKSTDFVFGSQVHTKPDNSQLTGLENLKICNSTMKAQSSTATTTTTNIFSGFGSGSIISPAKTLFDGLSFSGSSTNATVTNTDSTKPIVFGQSKLSTDMIFGETKMPTNNIFKNTSNLGTIATSTTTTTAATSVFGQCTTTKTLFGGQTSVIPTFGSLSVEGTTSSTSPFGTFGSGLFGTTASMIPSTTPGFGSEASNQFTSKITFDSNIAPSTNTITKSVSQPTNIFNAKPSIDETKKKSVSFLPTENVLSFSTLKLQSNSAENSGFKKNPNFTFDGAGSSVFGRKPTNKTEKKKSENSPNVKRDQNKNDDGREDEENENEDNYDPYFEPIIPLPDAIEIRTGEEDEEKIFCQRGKLYRFDSNTKEWKERGIGEMKILHHVENGTYRLLMRREQVHKIVCNILLTSNIKFAKLQLSDTTWMWAAMNYADSDNPAIERLAIRFKNVELSKEFKRQIDIVQKMLTMKQNQDSNEDNDQDDCYDDDYVNDKKYIDDADEDDYEEEEDAEEKEEKYVDKEEEDRVKDNKSTILFDDKLKAFKQSNNNDEIIFESDALFFLKNDKDEWNHCHTGNVNVILDKKPLGRTRVIFRSKEGDRVSDTLVTADAGIKSLSCDLEWSAVDNAITPAKKRMILFHFFFNKPANEMCELLTGAREYARKLNVHE